MFARPRALRLLEGELFDEDLESKDSRNFVASVFLTKAGDPMPSLELLADSGGLYPS